MEVCSLLVVKCMMSLFDIFFFFMGIVIPQTYRSTLLPDTPFSNLKLGLALGGWAFSFVVLMLV